VRGRNTSAEWQHLALEEVLNEVDAGAHVHILLVHHDVVRQFVVKRLPVSSLHYEEKDAVVLWVHVEVEPLLELPVLIQDHDRALDLVVELLDDLPGDPGQEVVEPLVLKLLLGDVPVSFVRNFLGPNVVGENGNWFVAPVVDGHGVGPEDVDFGHEVVALKELAH